VSGVDFSSFRPAVSVQSHLLHHRQRATRQDIGQHLLRITLSLADLRVDFYDDQSDAQVAWGQAPKSVRYYYARAASFSSKPMFQIVL